MGRTGQIRPPPQFLAVLQAIHDGMMAKVVLSGSESEPFPVYFGVKQGCVLAPVIFNLFLVAVTLSFRNDSACLDDIGIKFRLDGSSQHPPSTSIYQVFC